METKIREYLDLFHAAPENGAVFGKLQKHLREKGDRRGLASICLIRADRIDDPAEARRLRREAAQLLLAENPADERAAWLLLDLAAADPEGTELHRLAADAWAAAGKLGELVSALFDRAAGAERAESRAAGFRRCGELADTRIGRPLQAAICYRRAWAEQPEPAAADAMVGLMLAAGDAAGVVEWAGRSIGVRTLPEEKAERFKSLVRLSLTDPAAGRAAESLLGSELAGLLSKRDLRRLSEERRRQVDEWQTEAAAAERAAVRAADPKSAAAGLLRAASLHAAAGSPEAGRLVEAALDADPTDVRTIGFALSRLERTGDRQGIARLLRRIDGVALDGPAAGLAGAWQAALAGGAEERRNGLLLALRGGAPVAAETALAVFEETAAAGDGSALLGFFEALAPVEGDHEWSDEAVRRFGGPAVAAADVFGLKRLVEGSAALRRDPALLAGCLGRLQQQDAGRPELTVSCERLARLAAGRQARSVLLRFQAEGLLTLGPAEAALDPAMEAVCDWPSVEAVETLRQAAEKGGGWERLKPGLRRLAVDGPPAGVDRDGLLAAGELLDRELSVYEAAEAVYTSLAAGDDRSAGAAFERLVRLYRKQGRTGDLARLLEHRLGMVADREARRDLLAELVSLHDETLGDRPAAARFLRLAADEFPGDLAVLRRLEGWYRAEGDMTGLADVLERQLSAVSSLSEKARLQFLLGEIDLASEPERAAGRFLSVVALDPGNVAAREQLELLGDRGIAVRQIFTGLYDGYEREGRLARIVPWAGRLLGDEAFRADPDFCEKIGRYHQRDGGRPDEAMAWYRRAFELAPDDRDRFERIRHAAAEAGRLGDLVEMLDRSAAEQAAGVPAVLRLAEVLFADLHDHERAEAGLRTALNREPGSIEALRFAVRFYRETEQWTQYAAHAERLLGGDELPDDVRIGAMTELAEVYAGRLGLTERAIGAWRDLLEVRPDAPDALDALDGLYTMAGEWSELIGILRRKAAVATGEGRASLLVRIAGILEDKLGDRAGAVEIYRQALDAAPGTIQAVDALEAVFETDAPEAVAAGSVLADFHRRSGGEADLLRTLCELDARGAGGLETADEIVEIGRRLGQDEVWLVERELRRWLLDDSLPVDRPLFGRAVDAGRTGLLLKAVEGKQARMQHAVEKADLLMAAASVLAEVEPAAGRECAERARELDPENQEALDFLESAYERAGEWIRLSELAVGRANAERGASAGLARRKRAADVLSGRLGDHEAAERVLEPLLEDGTADREAISMLKDLAWQRGATQRAIQLTETLVRNTPDRNERTSLEADLCVLLLTGGQRERGLAAMRRLVESPENGRLVTRTVEQVRARGGLDADLVDLVEGVYRERGEWEGLAVLYEVKLAGTTGETERMRLMEEINRLYGEQLNDPSRAFDGLCRVLRAGPDNTAVRDELERLAGQLDRWSDLAVLYHEVAAQGVPHRLAVGLTRRAAELAEEICVDLPAAVRYYESLAGLLPSDGSVLATLDILCRKTGAWGTLAGAKRRAVEAIEDRETRLALMGDVVSLYEEQLNDTAGLGDALRRLYQLDPENDRVLSSLVSLCLETGDWPGLADVLPARVERAGSPEERRVWLLKLGEVYRDRLDDPVAAAGWLLKLAEEGTLDEEVLARLHDLMQQERSRPIVARAMAPVYERLGHWHDLVDAFESLFEQAADDTERLTLLVRIAEVYEHRLEQPALAFGVLMRAFRIDPFDVGVASGLDRLSVMLDYSGRLVGLYEEAIRNASGPAARALLLMSLGLIHEERALDRERAEAAYLEVLEAEPEHAGALDRLAGLYEASGAWVQLSVVLDRLQALEGDPELRTGLLFRLARVREERLGDPQAAAAAYEQVLARIDAGNLVAADALIRLYEADRNYEAAVAAYRRRTGLAADDTERTRFMHRAAAILLHELGRPGEGLDGLADVLSIDPGHLPTRNLLRSLFGTPLAEGAAAVLEPYLEAEGNHLALIEVYDIHTAAAVDALGRKPFVLKKIEIAMETMRDGSLAIGFASDLVDELPLDEDLVGAVMEAGARFGVWSDALGYWERAGGRATGAGRARALFSAGLVAEERMNDGLRAIGYYRQALGIEPGRLDILDRMERILSVAGEYTELLDIVARKAALAAPGAGRRGLLLQRAELLDRRLGRPEEAILAYEEMLGENADDVHVLTELWRLYDQCERYADAIVALERLVSLSADPAERVLLLLETDTLCRQRLGRTADGLQALGQALQLDAGCEEAESRLMRIAREPGWGAQAEELLAPVLVEGGRFERLAELRRLRLASLAGAAARVPVLRGIQGIFEERLGDIPRALEVAVEAYDEDRDDTAGLAEIERLALLAGGWPAVVTTVAGIAARTREGETSRLALLRYLSQTARERLADPEAAVEWGRAVLAEAPDDSEAYGVLAGLYEQAGRWEELVDVLARQTALLPRDEADDSRLRIAEVCRWSLSDPDRAAAVLNEVLAGNPGSLRAMLMLQEIYESAGRWSELCAVYERQVRVARGDSTRARLYSRMAELTGEKLGDRERSMALWEQVLLYDEGNQRALDEIEAGLRRKGDWQRLIAHLRRVRASRIGMAEKLGIDREVARIYLEHLDLEDDALAILSQVFAAMPEDHQTYGLLEAIYTRHGDWGKLVELLNFQLGSLPEDTKGHACLRLAALARQRLGDDRQFRRHLRRLLSLNPSAELLAEAARLLDANDRSELALELLDRLQRATSDAGERLALLWRLHGLAPDPDRWEWLEQALLVDPARSDVALALERQYAVAGAWTKLAAVHRRALTPLAGTGRLPRLRALAELTAERLLDSSAAFDLWREICLIDPADATAVARMAAAAGACGREDECIRDLEDLLPALEDRGARRTVELTLAAMLRDRPDGEPRAADLLEANLESGLDPGAEEFLASRAREHQQWGRLVKVLEVRRGRARGGDLLAVLEEMASICEHQTRDLRAAMALLAEMARLQPERYDVRRRLADVCAGLGEWELTQKALDECAALTADDRTRTECLREAAEIERDRLGRPGREKELLGRVLESSPDDRAALGRLEQLLEREQNWLELVRVAHRLATIEPDEDGRSRRWQRVAGLHEERLGNLSLAAEALEKAAGQDGPGRPAMLERLARLYRAMEAWNELHGTLQRHIAIEENRERLAGLLCADARLQAERLGDQARAADLAERAARLAPDSPEVVRTRKDLCLLRGDYRTAIGDLERLSAIETDAGSRIGALIELGALYRDRLADPDSARAVFDRILEADSGSLPAVRALKDFHRRSGDSDGYARMLAREKELAADDRNATAALLHEEGLHLAREKGETEAGIEALRRSVELDDDLDALVSLGDVCFESGDIRSAVESYRRVMERSDELARRRDRERTVRFRLAEMLLDDGDLDGGIAQLRILYRRAPDDMAVVLLLARSLQRTGNHGEALKAYQALLVRFKDRLERRAMVETYLAMGELSERLVRKEAAVRMYEKAYETDPGCAPALDALIRINEQTGDLEMVAHYALIAIRGADPDRAFELWMRLGAIYAGPGRSPEKALQAYKQAFKLAPSSLAALEMVGRTYLTLERPSEAVAVYEKLVELAAAEPARCIPFLEALADIQVNGLVDLAAGVASLNRILSLDPKRRDIFERITGILTGSEQWDELDRNYRLQIRRVGGSDRDYLARLWGDLALLLTDRLANRTDSIKALEALQALGVDQPEMRGRLARLYSEEPGMEEQAIAQHRALLERDDGRTDSLLSLFRLYKRTGRRDQAFAFAAAATVLNAADAEARAFHERGLGELPLEAVHVLRPELWHAEVVPNACQNILGEMFAILAHEAGEVLIGPQKRLPVRKKERIGLASGTPFATTASYVSNLFGLEPPEFYPSMELNGELRLEPVWPPTATIGYDGFDATPRRELLCLLAYWMTLAQPAYILSVHLRPGALRDLFHGVLAQFGARSAPPDAALPPNVWKALSRHAREELEKLIGIYEQQHEAADLEAWHHATRACGLRAGLLVSGDLSAVLNIVQRLRESMPAPVHAALVREMLAFSLSDRYFGLRRELGLVF